MEADAQSKLIGQSKSLADQQRLVVNATRDAAKASLTRAQSAKEEADALRKTQLENQEIVARQRRI